MNKAKQFGETVEGYNIPVLNEREIRASAGILYFFMFLAWMLVIFNENYFLIKLVNTIFLTDFIIRVLISPRYSPSLIIGRLIVGGQTPNSLIPIAITHFSFNASLNLVDARGLGFGPTLPLLAITAGIYLVAAILVWSASGWSNKKQSKNDK